MQNELRDYGPYCTGDCKGPIAQSIHCINVDRTNVNGNEHFTFFVRWVLSKMLDVREEYFGLLTNDGPKGEACVCPPRKDSWLLVSFFFFYT